MNYPVMTECLCVLFNEQEFLKWCHDQGECPDDVWLYEAVPEYAYELYPDEIYQDQLPEDETIKKVYPELAEKFEELNALIRRCEKPLSYLQGKRVKYR